MYIICKKNNTRIVRVTLYNNSIFIVQGYLSLTDLWYDISIYRNIADAMNRVNIIALHNTSI